MRIFARTSKKIYYTSAHPIAMPSLCRQTNECEI